MTTGLASGACVFAEGVRRLLAFDEDDEGEDTRTDIAALSPEAAQAALAKVERRTQVSPRPTELWSCTHGSTPCSACVEKLRKVVR